MPNAALKAAREPASIRYKNPGAMWGGKHANTWGAVSDVVLKDGQANHIAVFPDFVHGAAAQFALWKVSYCNMSLAAAIRKWSGHNSSAAYMAFLGRHVGITAQTWITPALLASPKGLALMQAQAQWEAGKPYPMTNAEWRQAQALVFPDA
jgi:hypothetical protein